MTRPHVIAVGLFIALGLVEPVANAAFLCRFTIMNNTRAVASDAHVLIAGTGGSLRTPAAILAQPAGCPAPAITVGGNRVDLVWTKTCVPINGTVTFNVTSNFPCNIQAVSTVSWTTGAVPTTTTSTTRPLHAVTTTTTTSTTRPAHAVTTTTTVSPTPTCIFDTNGDGNPDLVVPDRDRDGRCEFPSRRLQLRGTLRFTADTPVEFSGETVVLADEIIIDEGASLHGRPGSLTRLTLVALRGDLVSHGELNLGTSDDLILVSMHGGIHLDGQTTLVARDELLLDGRGGPVVVTPPSLGPSPFTLFSKNRIDLKSKGATGGIEVARAAFGGRFVTLDAVSQSAAVGDRPVAITEGALLTTDPHRTGLGVRGDVVLAATGDITVNGGAVIDAGMNVRVSTQRLQDDLCLGGGAKVEAGGRISVSGVHGVVGDDRTATLDASGVVRGVTVEGCRADVCSTQSGAAAASVVPLFSAADDFEVGVNLDINPVLASHNRVRRDARPADVPQNDVISIGPRNETRFELHELFWDFALATRAQTYADACEWGHSAAKTYGENLFAESGTVGPDLALRHAIESWAEEQNCYDVKTDTCALVTEAQAKTIGCLNPQCCKDPDGNPVCGHYTQMVWGATDTGFGPTRKIGCGVGHCNRNSPCPSTTEPHAWTYVVCRYVGKGNIVRKDARGKLNGRPYVP